MVLSLYAKERILFHRSNGHKAPAIQRLIKEEGISVSRVGIWKFLCHYSRTRCLARREGSGRPTKITSQVKLLVEQQMLADDETTAYQLHQLLTNKGIQISIATILRARNELGWTFRGSAYCQLIRNANKLKRVAWAEQYLDEAEDGFQVVIWSDESSIHKRYCYRKKGCPPKVSIMSNFLKTRCMRTSYTYIIYVRI